MHTLITILKDSTVFEFPEVKFEEERKKETGLVLFSFLILYQLEGKWTNHYEWFIIKCGTSC